MALPPSARQRVGDLQDPQGLLKSLGIVDPYTPIVPPKYKMGIETLVENLNRRMGSEGYSFQIEKNNLIGNGFTRVYITKQGDIHPSSYLDLQVGGNTPSGPAIRYQVAKENTFGVPGFPRLIGTQLGNTVNTFEDFVRAYHKRADQEGKSPQQTIWTTYQEGDPEFNLPGSGSVLTPSSSSGKISYEERTVRFMVPQNEPGITDLEKQQNYLRRVGGVIGSQTGLNQLWGYVPEVNQWNALVPGSQFTYSGIDPSSGRMINKAQVVRGVESEFKSQSTVREARQLANVPLVRDPVTGRLARLQPSTFQTGLTREQIARGEGVRKGWTTSSVILPGETAPRQVLSQSMLLADQADLPGAAYAGPGAFQAGGRDIYAIGEQMNSCL